jgi:hypothetical protein
VATKPPLIAWASRGAGAVAIVTAMLYLGLIVGEDQTGQLPASIAWFTFMAGAGLLAWFADRAKVEVGRRMVWGAFGILFVIGVLSIFTIGMLFLLASVLAVFSLSKTRVSRSAGAPDFEG